jgi:hypothetical protein
MNYRILRKGSSGDLVRKLQFLLNRALRGRFNIKEDGKFGKDTVIAVKKFQRMNWLVVDGNAGQCTWAALNNSEKYNILHRIILIPQWDNSSCWLASTSMLLHTSYPRSSVPSSLLASDGGLLNDSELTQPTNTAKFAQHFNLHMYPSQSWLAMGLANIIKFGPVATHILWNVSGYVSGAGSSGHFAVIAGIRGDGTELGTTLRIYDPWPPNRGKIESFGYAKLMRGIPALTYQMFQARR